MPEEISGANLEALIAHEARYFEIWSVVTRSSAEERGASAWFLDSTRLPHYQSANRALHLRAGGLSGGRSAPSLVAEIIAHYRGRGLPVVADVDPLAEEMGIGRELRRQGVTPVAGSTLLMRYGADAPPCLPAEREEDNAIILQRIANETGQGEARDWIHLAGADEDNAEDAAFWREVADLEARSLDCRLYLAREQTGGGAGRAVGACQLFSANGWAQIDSVMTHPEFRRRGIASRLVAHAVHDSLTLANTTTYLFTERGGAGEQVYRRLGFEVWGVDALRRHILW